MVRMSQARECYSGFASVALTNAADHAAVLGVRMYNEKGRQSDVRGKVFSVPQELGTGKSLDGRCPALEL